jgi:hypothetical protein
MFKTQLMFFPASTITGNEPSVTITMELTLNVDRNNIDEQPANNIRSVVFNVDSQADISVTM